MKLENQVTSLELSKKLKELGVKQESLYVWIDKFQLFTDESRIVTIEMYKERLNNSILSDEAKALVKTYSAFTVAELGEMLPWKVGEHDSYWYETGKTKKDDEYYPEHEVSYSNSEEVKYLQRASTEANARAKMLIYLLENKLITL